MCGFTLQHPQIVLILNGKNHDPQTNAGTEGRVQSTT